MKNNVRATLIILMLLSLLLCAAGCKKENKEPIRIILNNYTEGELTCFGVRVSIDDVQISDTNTCVSSDSEEDTFLTGGALEVVIDPEDIPDGAKLLASSLAFYVSKGENIFDVSIVAQPMEYGQTYTYKLVNRDGTYSVWLDLTK